MGILGVILGIIGMAAALLAALLGIIGGVPAVILGLLAVLFGVLARKNARKGIPAIVIGIIVIVLAAVLTINGINSAKFNWEQVKANPEKAPTVAKYVDKVRPEFGFLGFLTVTQDPEELKLIGDEVKALLEGTEPKTPVITEAPVTEKEAPAAEKEDSAKESDD